jgi:PPE-repeat protein
MDFAMLPPEINSARMYAGAGSGPMLAAAMAWEGLAAAMNSAASSCQSEIAALTAGPWLGPSSMLMAAAAAPYVVWTRTTAAQAEQTANQAKAAAAAYEAAFAETVPPPAIAANRSLLLALVATNIFGQNTPAIATTEAQYAEMWAQDAGAMYGYAGASASATTLTPFTSPPQSTNPGGSAGQAAAAAQATGTAAGNVQSTVSNVPQAIAAVPNALNSLASAAAPAQATPADLLALLANLSGVFVDPELSATGLGVDSGVGITALPYDVVGALTGFHTDDIVSGWAGIETWPGTAAVAPTPFPVITNLAGGSALSAGLGEAKTIGALSVPPTWTAETTMIRPLAVALPAASVGAAAEAASAGSTGSLFSQMALAGMAGRAMAGTGGAGGPGRRERIGTPTTSKKAAPPEIPTVGPVVSIAAELRELASLRDSGVLTDEEFTEQKKRLLAY